MHLGSSRLLLATLSRCDIARCVPPLVEGSPFTRGISLSESIRSLLQVLVSTGSGQRSLYLLGQGSWGSRAGALKWAAAWLDRLKGWRHSWHKRSLDRVQTWSTPLVFPASGRDRMEPEVSRRQAPLARVMAPRRPWICEVRRADRTEQSQGEALSGLRSIVGAENGPALNPALCWTSI